MMHNLLEESKDAASTTTRECEKQLEGWLIERVPQGFRSERGSGPRGFWSGRDKNKSRVRVISYDDRGRFPAQFVSR